MNDAITLIENTKESLQECNRHIVNFFYEKYLEISSKNIGYDDKLTKIPNILDDESESTNIYLHGMTFFKYAPVTFMDIEEIFSKYKHLLSNKRRSIVF